MPSDSMTDNIVRKLAEKIEADLWRTLTVGYPRRQTTLLFERGYGWGKVVELDDDGKPILPCPKCGPILKCPECMAMVS